MLHSYRFSNFQSFREKVEVNLTINKKVTMTEWMDETPTGDRVSKLLAVVGANGSGKTALLKPMAFMSWFISNSFHYTAPDENIPITPHATSKEEPTEMECTVDFDGRIWRYELCCTSKRVLHEALYQKQDKRFSYVFVRDWDSESKAYTVKQQDFGLAPQEARKVRPNVSLIAWAAQFGVPLAVRMVAPYLFTNVNILGRISVSSQDVQVAAHHFSIHQEQYKRMETLLSAWDFGLSGVDLQEISINTPDGEEKKVWLPSGKHTCKGNEFQLPFALESSGTQSAFVLLSRLLPTLEVGGLAVIDEFENDLHPHMLEPILDLFANPATNPHHAQLVFSCHAIEVLNLVHKSQVMLIEKDEECESRAIRMDEVKGIRNDDNYYAKYMAGAYGATPVF
ncbi:MAG: AAA family ATPase [Mariprofundaceae bacterium]